MTAATTQLRQQVRMGQVTPNQLDTGRRGGDEVSPDVDTGGGDCAIADELRKLATVAAAQVQNRAAGDSTENVSLGRPLDQPIQ